MVLTLLVLASVLNNPSTQAAAGQTSAQPAAPVSQGQPEPAEAKAPPKVVVHRVAGPEPLPAPRDPALISVPSNTLGARWITGPDGRSVGVTDSQEPLWVRSDRASAEARLARARADEAELHNELLKLERADDRHGRRIILGGVGYGRIIGLRGASGGTVGGLRGPVTVTTRGFNDAFDQAQLRFGRNAAPPIIGIQNQTDQAIINSRKPAAE